MKKKVFEILERTVGKTFATNIIKLLSGAVIGMAIGFLVTPILTRFYSPEEFGLFNLITSLVGSISGISAFRYGMAIVLPKRDEDAVNLVALALFGVVFTGFWTGLVFIGGSDFIATHYKKPELAPWLWAVPAFIVLNGTYESLRYWTTRKQYFGAMSTTSVLSSTSSAGAKIFAGTQRIGYSGLIFGQLFGQTLGTLTMLFVVLVSGARKHMQDISWQRMRAMARKYIDFPKYNVPVTLLNGVARNLPTFGLGYFFPNSVVGLYGMAFLLLQTPVNLLSDALRQVFYQKATQTFHAKGDLFGETMRLTLILFGIAFIPALILIFFATPVLTHVLGEKWKDVGIYASVLTPYMTLLVVATPAAAIFPIVNLQRWIFIWQVLSFIGTCIAIGVGGYVGDPIFTVALFSAFGTLLQALLIAGMAYITKHPELWKDSYEKEKI